MRAVLLFIHLSVVGIITVPVAVAQGIRPMINPPSANILSQADVLADTVFSALREGRSQDLAEFLNRHVGYAEGHTAQVKAINDYKSQLDVIRLSPPDGPLGRMDGYDLLEESYLPGSNRYFRRTYLSYHEGAPLVWEFRYYVRSDGTVTLNAFAFSPSNPFEYIATPAMLVNRWYE